MTRTLGVVLLLLVSACATVPPPVQDGPPSDESLHQLLQITNQQQLMAGATAQVDTMMQTSMKQALKGETISSQKQAILDEMRGKMVAVMKDELSWSKLEPATMDIYRKSFTQGEVNDMIAFYSTPGGHAVISKMPTVMQNTMQMLQAQMGPMMEKIQVIEKDTLAKLKAVDDKAPAAKASASGSP